MKKLFCFFLLAVTISPFLYFTNLNKSVNKEFIYNNTSNITTDGVLAGENSDSFYKEKEVIWVNPSVPEADISPYNDVIIISEVSPAARTYYDLQSNGSCHFFERDPNNPNNLHAVFMVSTDPNPWNTRNIRYFFSSNGGTSWDYLGNIFVTRSGFPSLTFTSDGRAIVAAHNNDGGGVVRTQIAIDVSPGAGSWTIMDPGAPDPLLGPIWPIIECAHTMPNNKVLFIASKNGQDSVSRNILTLPGTFSGWQPIPGAAPTQRYAVGIGTKWSIAYHTLSGGAAIVESQNEGVTWSSPVTIWNWNPTDSMGTLRGIDCGYSGTVPNVVFEVCHVDPAQGTFNPNSPSKIYFWAPNINNGVPVKIDSAGGLTGTNPTNDVFTSVCRPVIGYIQNFIFVAYSKARSDTSSLGNNYFDVYVSCSGNGGASWGLPLQVTNNTGPLVDCRYVSISNKNSSPSINLIFQQDSIPGSNVNGAPNSLAKMMYARITGGISCPLIGISNINNEVPRTYFLNQNYPNPFNPKTQIEFGVPRHSFVTLNVYDIEGKKIAELLSRALTAGNYKIDWDASNFSSGVYIYTLRAGGYFKAKKMVLIK